MVVRIFVENREEIDIKAGLLKDELIDFFGTLYPEVHDIPGLRICKSYLIELKDEEKLSALVENIFSEPRLNRVFYDSNELAKYGNNYFGVEFLPGQFDNDADAMEQCAELVLGYRPIIKIAEFFIFETGSKVLSDEIMESIKTYLINPIDKKEASLDIPQTLSIQSNNDADKVPILNGFRDEKDPQKIADKFSLAMSADDIKFCQDYFAKENRDPSMTELLMLDTYWSDHCRHTTFNTFFEEIIIEDSGSGSSFENSPLKKALELYEEARREVYGIAGGIADGNAGGNIDRKRSLMDMATIGAKLIKKRGLLDDLDESEEVNACSINVDAKFSDGVEKWLLMFKNETHNHPTEMEPFGGAATCLGGAIRDPLSGRSYVHQAMRITGGGDPRSRQWETLPGKLPQIKIAREASRGYSFYGNQIGIASSHASEFYHPGFIAKRMELGAVIGAVPKSWVKREEPLPGDVVILVGGKTGRDGVGGATGSSMAKDAGTDAEDISRPADSGSPGLNPAGNPREERKLVRLFRKPEICRLIKRCNDFGAGGVSVAVGELARGLDIELDAVPVKYPGLDGTELAISESQERMAILCSAEDAKLFIKAADEENLEAVIIATVTGEVNNPDFRDERLRMFWKGNTIVDLSRNFLNSNGAPRFTKIKLEERPECKRKQDGHYASASVLLDKMEHELSGLRSGSRRGLQEIFDGSAGGNSILFPWGGAKQGTPECGMASLLPALGKFSQTASIMSFGYDPVSMSLDPYKGAKASIKEALAKYACLGGDPFKSRLSLQEYFEKTSYTERWALPVKALLGALEAQIKLGIPAIGGKDSMSGNYQDALHGIDIKVPPSLVAFAAGTIAAERICSGALSGKAGNVIVLFGSENSGAMESVDEWDRFSSALCEIEKLHAASAVKAAYPVLSGGVAVSMALMAFGNYCGVEAYADSFSHVNENNYQGSFLAEISEESLKLLDKPHIIAGRTLEEAVYRIVKGISNADLAKSENPENLSAEIPLEVLHRAYEYPLSMVYPQTSNGATWAEPMPAFELASDIFSGKISSKSSRVHIGNLQLKGEPLVLLPVFPGTNCEWEMERAFLEYKARTKFVVFRNRRPGDIADSYRELAAAINEANIIALSGGFSPGSGKFIAQILRNPLIVSSLHDFLENRKGLMLGISEGFQALVKAGLLPFGTILPHNEKLPDNSPVFAENFLGRHISRMVRTRVMANNSPWLSLEEEGNIHLLPFSTGEGVLNLSEDMAGKLFSASQVPFCFVDENGNPCMTEPDNPGPSMFAIEALTSPDGRILGKMTHSERSGNNVHINIPGNKKQGIFEAGLRYFK